MQTFDMGGPITSASGYSQPVFPGTDEPYFSLWVGVGGGTPAITLYGTNDDRQDVENDPSGANWEALGTLAATGKLDYNGACTAFRWAWSSNTNTLTPKGVSK